MKTLLWIARHGTTTDSNKPIFRGNRDTPLDQQGFRDAYDLKKFFSDKKYHLIFTSDMTRGVQTGVILAGEKDGELMPAIKGLRQRDIGYLTGKDKKEYAKEMKFFIDHPDEIPKDGESTNQFERGRVFPLLIEGIEMGENGDPPIIVGHSSVIHALGHLLYGKNHKNLSVKPGGVVEVYIDKDEIQARPAYRAGEDDSSYVTKT